MNELERIPIIASGLAAGLTQEVIAGQIGMSRATVSRRSNKDDVKALVEQAKDKMMKEYLPKSVENIGYAINKFQELKPAEDNQLRYLGYRASEKMLENIGILGTPSPGFQILINQTNQIVSPIVQAMLDKHNGDVIDVDAE
jgi:transcriptional regulator with XRE-family HTH domain